MLEIQRRNNDFSTQAYSQVSNRQRDYQPLDEHKSNLPPKSHGLSPAPISHRKPIPSSRPRSIQRNLLSDDGSSAITQPSYGGGARADQSALDHIRRIRRNMPSQQHSRMQRDLSYDYISAVGVSRGSNNGALSSNNSKIENYKRIK